MVTGNESINVKKRNGRGTEKLDIDKIHSMVEYAVEDIKGVSASQIEMNSGLQFYEGMSTDEIQQILIKSANDLISLENPNYQYVAARLLLFSLTPWAKLSAKAWQKLSLLGCPITIKIFLFKVAIIPNHLISMSE